MSELKYCIDQFMISTVAKIELVGWIGTTEEYQMRLKFDESIYKEVIVEKMAREDVQRAIGIEELYTGFKAILEIDDFLEHDIVAIEVKEVKEGNQWKCLHEIFISEILNQQILITRNIDEVIEKDDGIEIKGWAFDVKGEKVHISIVESEHKVDAIQRMDVKLAYNNIVKDSNIGFLIKIPNKQMRNITINYSIGNYMESQEIDISVWRRQQQISRYKEKFKWISICNVDNMKKACLYIKVYGIKSTWAKMKNKMSKTFEKQLDYNDWLKHHLPNEEELEMQRNIDFEYTPQISIVVPTYNTPKQFLIEMIESVMQQTYPNWQLCIADGGSKNQDTLETLKLFAEKDARVKVTFLTDNYGISGNTNKCLELATGEFIGLFDHDDLLTPNALFEVVKVLNDNKEIDFIYSDEDKTDETTQNFFDAHFKPDFSPDMLRSQNYICHFTVFRKSLLSTIGQFRPECDGSQDHDIILRLTEQTDKIVHIPKILYHWRVHNQSTAAGISAKEYTITAGIRAVQDHLARIGLEGKVSKGLFTGSYRVEYEINHESKVSIIIPNKDHKEDLKKCIESIMQKTTYSNYEIIIVENNSETAEIRAYYDELAKDAKIKVVEWKKEFNYSAINNYGAKFATGDYYILLNNDIEIITPNWIEEMLMYCQRKDVGIVGAKLYYPDNTIQHAGVIIGFLGVAGHAHVGKFRTDPSYFGRSQVVQNVSAVTAACLMIRKDVYEEIEGLDEKFQVAFNDVDLCMKVRKKGKLVVFTPYAEAYHYESKSRGQEDTPEKIQRFNGEIKRFEEKWGLYERDPYYNRNLSLEKEDFSLKIIKGL